MFTEGLATILPDMLPYFVVLSNVVLKKSNKFSVQCSIIGKLILFIKNCPLLLNKYLSKPY